MPGDQQLVQNIDLQPTNVNESTHLLNMIPFASPGVSQTQQTEQQPMHDWDSSVIGPASLRLLKRRSQSCSSLLDSNRMSALLNTGSPAKLDSVMEESKTLQTSQLASPSKNFDTDLFSTESPAKQIDDSIITIASQNQDQLPMMDFIKEIMMTYKDALDNLTQETKQLREELEDQKQQM